MAQEAHSRTVYRRPPCPSYDVEGTEAWLTDLAREGLLLESDGFFAGFAAFEKTVPTRVKYRLEAAQKHAGLWSEDGGEPDEAQVELCAQYRWEYVARHGQFYIYRSADPSARELNTDPKVQALALNAVKKRLVSDLISLLVWTVLYPLLFLRAGLFTTILGLGTWRFALLTVLVLWEIVRSVRALTVLGRFQKKLRQGLTPAHTKNWRQGAARYHAANALRLLLALALAVCLLHVWSDRIMDTGLVPLDEYDGKLPFATMRELAAFDGAAVTARRETMRGLRFNSVEDHSDWLAPRCISYHEVADFPAPTERRCVAGCTSTTSRPPPRGLRTGSCRSAGGMTGLRSTTGRLTRPRSRPMRSPPMKARSTSPRCSSGAETCSCAPILSV